VVNRIAISREVNSIKRSARPRSRGEPVDEEEVSLVSSSPREAESRSTGADLRTKEALKEDLENLAYSESRGSSSDGIGGEHQRTLEEVGRTFTYP